MGLQLRQSINSTQAKDHENPALASANCGIECLWLFALKKKQHNPFWKLLTDILSTCFNILRA